MLIDTRFQPRIYSTVNSSKNFGTIFSFSCFCSNLGFLGAYFVIDKPSKELEQTDLYSVNRLMAKRVIRDNNCKIFEELKIVVLLCSEILLRVSSDISLRYFTTSTFRRSCSSPRSKFTRHSLKN